MQGPSEDIGVRRVAVLPGQRRRRGRRARRRRGRGQRVHRRHLISRAVGRVGIDRQARHAGGVGQPPRRRRLSHDHHRGGRPRTQRAEPADDRRRAQTAHAVFPLSPDFGGGASRLAAFGLYERGPRSRALDSGRREEHSGLKQRKVSSWIGGALTDAAEDRRLRPFTASRREPPSCALNQRRVLLASRRSSALHHELYAASAVAAAALGFAAFAGGASAHARGPWAYSPQIQNALSQRGHVLPTCSGRGAYRWTSKSEPAKQWTWLWKHFQCVTSNRRAFPTYRVCVHTMPGGGLAVTRTLLSSGVTCRF